MFFRKQGAAKENKSSAGQIVGVWEAYDIYDPKQGTMAEEDTLRSANSSGNICF